MTSSSVPSSPIKINRMSIPRVMTREEMQRLIYGLSPLDEIGHMVIGASWKDGEAEVQLRCGTTLRAPMDANAFFRLAIRDTNKCISTELLEAFRKAIA